MPRPGEVLLRVTAVGLCGSDLHWYEAAGIGATHLADPLVLGHECAAVISSGPRTGARVAVEPADPCGICESCLAGRGELCAAMRFSGHTPTDGALRTWLAWPERLLVHLPDTISDPEASLLEPLGVALHAIDLAALQPGMRVAVIGTGPIGLLLIRALHAAGVRDIVATDLLAHRVEAARASGALDVWLTGRDQHSKMHNVDVVFECAGTDEALATALQVARPGGRLILVGIPADNRTSFEASEARRKGLTFVFCRRMRAQDLPRAVELVAGGSLSLEGLVTDTFPLAEGSRAFTALAERRGLKVVIQPEAEA